KQIVDGIVAGWPEVKSIVQNINDKRTNRLLGDKNKTLWGADEIHDQLLGIDFAISPLSFYQVNPQQTERLYQTAIDNAGLDGNQTVIDAYCGIGTISLAVAKHAKQVYGVEIVPAAIEDAKHNAKRNGIKNAKFVVGDRKSTRLNSSHVSISYAVFCLKKKKHINLKVRDPYRRRRSVA